MAEKLKCTVHGNQLQCPGAFACPGWLHVATESTADNAPTEADRAEGLAILADARYLFGADFDAWLMRLKRAAADKREDEARKAELAKEHEHDEHRSGAV